MKEIYQKVNFEPHKEIIEGAEILYRAVSTTMGPSGQCVVIDLNDGTPKITKDGVTVAKAINLKENLQGVGANLIKEVAAKTNEAAGDGTTTATVFSYNLLKKAYAGIATGHSPIEVKRGIEHASELAMVLLKDYSREVKSVEDIVSIGTISANGDKQIGMLIADAIEKVGKDGIITIEPAKSVNTTLEVVEGLQIDSGFSSPYFVTNQEKLTSELDKPYVLVTTRKISSLSEILNILQAVSDAEGSLLIVADEIEGEALQTLLINKVKGNLMSCGVRAPSYGDNRINILSDIALMTGATMIDASSPLKLENIKLEHLGRCSKIIATKTTTTIIGREDEESSLIKEKVQERIAELRTAIDTAAIDDLQKAQLKKRLSKLAGGVAVIKVGGTTEVEIFEKKDRVEDALNATMAAVQEGILPGGGVALLKIGREIKKLLSNKKLTRAEMVGVGAFADACESPFRVIVQNAGETPEVIIEKIVGPKKSFDFGFNAFDHTTCNMLESGILDPLKVERCAVENSVSIVGLIITSNCVITTEREEN
jgi:chaperonin GroEL